MTGVSPYPMINLPNAPPSTSEDDRQLRISAFKSKISTLRATSKVYNIHSSLEGGDVESINTLDSSVVTTATGVGGVERAVLSSCAALPATPNAASTHTQKRSPVETTKESCEYDKRTSSGSGTGSNSAAVMNHHYEVTKNPFFDSDSSSSEGGSEENEGFEIVPKDHDEDGGDEEEERTMDGDDDNSNQPSVETEASSLNTIEKDTIQRMEMMNNELQRAASAAVTTNKMKNLVATVVVNDDDGEDNVVEVATKSDEEQEKIKVATTKGSGYSATSSTNDYSSFGGFSIQSIDHESSDAGRDGEAVEIVTAAAATAVEEEYSTQDMNISGNNGAVVSSTAEMTSPNESTTLYTDEDSSTEDDDVEVAVLTYAASKAIHNAKNAITKNPFLNEDDVDDVDESTVEEEEGEYMPMAFKTTKDKKKKKKRSAKKKKKKNKKNPFDVNNSSSDVDIEVVNHDYTTSDSISTITEVIPNKPSLEAYGRRDSNQRLRRVLKLSQDLVNDDNDSSEDGSPMVVVNKYSLKEIELDKTSAIGTSIPLIIDGSSVEEGEEYKREDTEKEEDIGMDEEEESMNPFEDSRENLVASNEPVKKSKAKKIVPSQIDNDVDEDDSSTDGNEPWLDNGLFRSWNNDTRTSKGGAVNATASSVTSSNFTEIYLADSSSSTMSHDDDKPLSHQQGVKSTTTKKKMDNPFAELLRLRQTRKLAYERLLQHKSELGSVADLSGDSTSNEDSTMTSLNSLGFNTLNTGSNNKFPMVYCNENEDEEDNINNNESMEGMLFSDLKKALSTLPSVSIEDESSADKEEVQQQQKVVVQNGIYRRSDAVAQEDTDDDDGLINGGRAIVVKEGESCAISSLKDEVYALNKDIFNDDPFEDDDDLSGVGSVPKSPADIHDISQVHLLAQECADSDEANATEAFSPPTNTKTATRAVVVASKNNMKKKNKNDASGDDSVSTVACSNSLKAEPYHKGEERPAHIITPPRKAPVISDGSISTKDSILGKTINVANSDLVAERIYLESLRAQVLAELKVHVADEEIRLALDARLNAIQDYYKRKATVVSLSRVTPTLSLGDLPKVKPTLVHDRNIEDANYNNGMSRSNDNDASPSYPEQRQNSHRFAFERVQSTIDEAIRAAHNQSPRESTYVPGEENDDEDDDKKVSSTEEEGEQIPLNIFTKDTFWDDEADPYSPGTLSGGGNNNTPEGDAEATTPPSHTQTIYNAWTYYRCINSVLFDSRIYDYEFQLLQDDPLYPYLNSLMGIADGGEDGYSNEHKRISQKVKDVYADKSPHRVCHLLAKDAEAALPELKSICAYIGNKLGMQTMAVGPLKKPSEALLKCEKKYGGDPLLVTDYCRVSLFAKDIASLLALIEIVLSKYAGIVRRIKLSSLKVDHVPLVGGYRDCKINLDIGGHICEIQVHLVSMWLVMEGKGFTHYRECCEHNVDISSFDIGKMLSGLERKVLADLIKMGEHELKNYPIVSLTQSDEAPIRDYFALASMYLYYGVPSKAEYVLRRTVKLRSESDSFGPCHSETLLHLELLWKSLKHQHKYKSASSIKNQIRKVRKEQNKEVDYEPELSELCKTDQCGAFDHVCDMILDPSKNERQEEKLKADTVEDSRALWLAMRKSFFS